MPATKLAEMGAEAQSSASLERVWWLRLALVLQSPASVFAWLRDDSVEAASARQEPITAVTFVAGVAIFLSTRTAGRLFDEVEFDSLLIVVECVIAGLLVAIQNFWILGGAVYLGGRAADSAAT
jgi:predicted MFS family arabinose efflux permease